MEAALTVFEFDKIVEKTVVDTQEEAELHAVPHRVFVWLELQCLQASGDGEKWLRLTQHLGRRAIQCTSYVGVIRAPCGYQIEVLPKIGRDTGIHEARGLLIQMVRCLFGFRHIQGAEADIAVAQMPLLDVFIQQFLLAAHTIIKRGLRSHYATRHDHRFTLRGKLLLAEHIRHNLVRADRFFTEHDEFSTNRPENRLLHTVLRRILSISSVQENQRLARELCFIVRDVPESENIERDIQHIRLDHSMSDYKQAMDWARLLLRGLAPLTGQGEMRAPALLFPMDALFEACVEQSLAKQLIPALTLKAQASSRYLIEHEAQRWFKMRPDYLVKDATQKTCLVLDAKWKLLDARKSTAREKYQLSQADIYQLYAYGQHYLNGIGEVVLIYPKTDIFFQPLPVFRFPHSQQLKLWVVPFCLQRKRLLVPEWGDIAQCFQAAEKEPREFFTNLNPL